MFGQLLWKECRENLWKVTFLSAVYLAITAILFRARLWPDEENSVAIGFTLMLALPLVFSLDIFAAEMSNRTIHLLFKIPVPRWKIFFSKILVCLLGMTVVILAVGLLMELLSHGREVSGGWLFINNLGYGIAGLILFAWFCPFAAQSRSEAGSLVALVAVLIGWSIVYFWADVGNVRWAEQCVPFYFQAYFSDYYVDSRNWVEPAQFRIVMTTAGLVQSVGIALVLTIACYRFAKIRRYL